MRSDDELAAPHSSEQAARPTSTSERTAAVYLCKTGITLQTSASLHGRALSQTLVALDDNAITAP